MNERSRDAGPCARDDDAFTTPCSEGSSLRHNSVNDETYACERSSVINETFL